MLNQLQDVTAAHQTNGKTWAKALVQPAQEFGPTKLPVLAGAIPEGLQGSLYRNGPARLTRGSQQVGHWFDGDGAILRVHFTNSGATGVYRYVQTAGYQTEEQAGELRWGGYGMLPPGAVWERFRQPLKNAANTSVLALPDKLLALWEGGQPHALDLQTLETFGLDDLQGLEDNLSYSAHPKRDPQTGEIFNFGVTLGRENLLQIYRSDRTGRIQVKAAIPLEGTPLIHDFVLAGPYLVFLIPPVRMQPLPVLLKLKSFSDALTWKPEKGTQVMVIDRETLTVVSRSEAPPWFQWHFGNGYVDQDGNVVSDLVRYEDFQTNQFLKEVATGHTQTSAKGTLWRLRINPQSGNISHLEQVLDRSCEFPVVNPQEVGQANRYTYLSIHPVGVDIAQELFGAIARFDYQTNSLTEANLGNQCYPMEPIYAPDAHNPRRGWIITVVFDSAGKAFQSENHNCSEVWIFDAEHLDDSPVCRLGLPSVIPLGFHGTWSSA
jgi:carotenoid cleavage dioxygenase-like enzyme